MEGWQNTSEVPEAVDENVRGYVEMARGHQPPDARYLMNHRGHFVFVKPEEKALRQRGTDPPHHLHRD